VFDLRAIREIDVPALENVSHGRSLHSSGSTSGFGSLRIQLVAFTEGGLLISVTEIELRVISLCLGPLGPLHELSRLSTVR
jgi:hypothetical protein